MKFDAKEWQVVDPRGLFVFSGLVDQIRDLSQSYLDAGTDVSSEDLQLMKDQLANARANLKGTLSEEARAQFDLWSPELNVANLSVGAILHRAAMLSRFLDLVHQAPTFDVQHLMTQQGISERMAELGGEEPTGDVDNSDAPFPTPARMPEGAAGYI